MKHLDSLILKLSACFVMLFCGVLSFHAAAQDINGELILYVPFEEDSYDASQWYLVQNNDNQADILGLTYEEGPEGGSAMVIYTLTLPTVALNNIQYTNETLPLPEGAGQYPWRVTFWIQVKVAPFIIRPIIAMSADPWTGTSFDYTIETADVWEFVDVTLDAESALNTDPLLFIFHMGNPGDEYDENEIWLDELKVYLLNEEQTSITDWMLLNE
ncbi:MAG: hypothetical protein JXR73_11065 [Candidatus Omnitrophica bacterium]|nr:hypothetical protein [Candidatus Omnitrophota bacterium]